MAYSCNGRVSVASRSSHHHDGRHRRCYQHSSTALHSMPFPHSHPSPTMRGGLQVLFDGVHQAQISFLGRCCALAKFRPRLSPPPFGPPNASIIFGSPSRPHTYPSVTVWPSLLCETTVLQRRLVAFTVEALQGPRAALKSPTT